MVSPAVCAKYFASAELTLFHILTGNGVCSASTNSVDKFVDIYQDKPQKPLFMRVWQHCLFGRQVRVPQRLGDASRLYTSGHRPLPQR